MAHISRVIRQSVVNRILSSNSFNTWVGGRLFFHLAPETIPGTTTPLTKPYAVFDILPISEDRNSTNKFYEFILQVNVYDTTQDKVENGSDYLTQLIEDAEKQFSFVGYKVVSIIPQPVVNLGFTDDVWCISISYKFNLQQ
jgi:hypothetical protein